MNFFARNPRLRPVRVPLTVGFLCGVGVSAHIVTHNAFKKNLPATLTDQDYIRRHEQYREDMNFDPISKFPLPGERPKSWHRKYQTWDEYLAANPETGKADMDHYFNYVPPEYEEVATKFKEDRAKALEEWRKNPKSREEMKEAILSKLRQ